MVAQYANGTKETLNSQVAYLIVETKESLINDNPNGILGTIQENGGDEWTCVSAEHFDPAKMSDGPNGGWDIDGKRLSSRSEEHTSELQSRQYLVCRLLLEKKKKTIIK